MPSPTDFKVTPYEPQYKEWPYSEEDFQRQDNSPDSNFYSRPRFVTHIDSAAINALRAYYAQNLPRRGRILDLCSSWISHLPKECEQAVQEGTLSVVGVGMNHAELERNALLAGPSGRRVVQDLNSDPELVEEATKGGLFDAAACVVSIDYLTRPLKVLRSARESTREGGSVHLAVSNRCFPTKVVGRWLQVNEKERLKMVGDYLWFAGWRRVEIVEVVPMREDWNSGDPLWVVRGFKE
ncbi:hypothetical protein NA57DRAFT_48572 [Rhizodiscina lignyota]|uniref:S-adenosyl-L-methionine-dependent methyltransferase n=1 Tax=Rhizodiscina lignyota TaxID=1504668 RepID=A0A9P4I3V8_9PEZI|nr:hypothetical protein NA57DRAFT_48572 [Rhizodiscina lignyota]